MSQYHVVSYVLYMSIMGVCGILDHCGVKFKWTVTIPNPNPNPLSWHIPWFSSNTPNPNQDPNPNPRYIHIPIYNTIDHDNHHLLFDINYGFPFAIMDYIHGTHTSSNTSTKPKSLVSSYKSS